MMSSKNLRLLLIGSCVAMLMTSVATRGIAQDLLRVAPFSGRSVTPAEQVSLINTYRMSRIRADSLHGAYSAIDTLDVKQAIRSYAQRLIQARSVDDVSGMQLDPMGTLLAFAKENVEAQRAFAKRLASPGLTLDQRAYTLRLAVEAFQDQRSLDGLMLAKQYADQLDALPAAANGAKFKGRLLMASGYYDVGDGAMAAEYVLRALSLVKEVPFEQREYLMNNNEGGSIPLALRMLSDVMLDRAAKRAFVDSVGNAMLALVRATPEQLANDTRYRSYASRSARWTNALKSAIGRNAMIGTPMPPVVGTHWYNTDAPTLASDAAPGAKQIPTADGRVRVFEFGGMGCKACLYALPKMQRLRARFAPQVDFWYIVVAEQRWGATECTPDESAEHIRKYYVTLHKNTLPMAVWAGPVDDSTSRPGAVLARSHPTFDALDIRGVPAFVVVDGRGVIRRYIDGNTPSLERELSATVTYLLKEAGRTAPPPSQSTARSN